MSKTNKITARKPKAKREGTFSHVREKESLKTVDSPVAQILHLQRTLGNQAVQRLFESGTIQAKLKIGKPGDKYEKEADRVADQVMRMPEPKISRQTEEEEEELVQPKPIAAQITPLVQRQVEPEEEEEEELVQPKLFSIEHPTLQRQAEPEEEEEEPIQTKLLYIERPIIQRQVDPEEKEEEKAFRETTPKGKTIPVLPGYSQVGKTCGAASLITALIVWDREQHDPSLPNNMVVMACDLILTYLAQYKDEVIKGWRKRDDLNYEPKEVYNLAIKRIEEIRDQARKPGVVINEQQYQEIAMTLYLLFVDETSGLKINQIEQIQRTLGLHTGQVESGLISYEDIWFNSIIRGLKPGEIAQVSWYVKTGPHSFLIGRLQNEDWFLSDQGTRPATEIQAASLLDLKKKVDAAAKSGYWIYTGKGFAAGVWTGIKLLAGPKGVMKAVAGLVAPDTFLAEVDAGLLTLGERVYSGSFLSRHYKFNEAKHAANSLSLHGALIIEMPAGVYSVYQTNLVSESNSKVTNIDEADSTGGLLMQRKFHSAWLRVNSGKTSTLFRVY